MDNFVDIIYIHENEKIEMPLCIIINRIATNIEINGIITHSYLFITPFYSYKLFFLKKIQLPPIYGVVNICL